MLKKTVFNFLKDDSVILVFPTENTARSYLSDYVREQHTSILASRAMAFDDFKALISPKRAQKPANQYYRLAFVSNFLENSTGLSYIYKDEFYSYRQRFIPFMTKILPTLSEIKDVRIPNINLYNDLHILKNNYQSFLSKFDLFEPGWEEYDLSNIDKTKKYVLVGSDSDLPMQMLLKRVGKNENIISLGLDDAEPKAFFNCFETEEAELEYLFCQLDKLKNEGVALEDIIITSPRINELASRLDRKSQEYDIPLSYVKSLKLKDTVPGKYLYAIKRCIDEKMSFYALENLLLPMGNASNDDNKNLINFMIENNIKSGSLEFTNDELFQKLKENKVLQDYYKLIKSSIVSISEAHDGDKLISALHNLTTCLLGPEEFRDKNEEDRDVYSFIFAELGNIYEVLKSCGLKMTKLFNIFMNQVDSLSYVSQNKKQGIRVYAYGQDQLLSVGHKFLFALNDSNAVVKRQVLDFLEDNEVPIRETYDVTEGLLNYYVHTPNIYISGSEVSYDGSQSIPTYFVSNNLVKKATVETKSFISQSDVISKNQAMQTVFDKKGFDVARLKGFMPKAKVETVLSYTSINNYITCPYKAFLKNTLIDNKVPDSFEPAMQDDTKIGDFLHKVIQAFMKNHKDTFLTEDKIEIYSSELIELINKKIETSGFDDYTKKSIVNKYTDSMVSLLINLFDPRNVGPFKPVVNEYKLDKNPSLVGYIDTIIENQEGDYYLIDYKKGAGDATYQLILYKQLFQEEDKNNVVNNVFFYSMRDSKLKFFKQNKYEEQEFQLDQDIKKTQEGYESGDWVATPSKDNCKNCSERGICRRRFNLQ